ncbi:hypothetical protein BMAA0983 [Burkholderia mallei ATCC 23344]|uniref:Uncharacterized protein n=1 Tax=Burkholderia mallei (strain ATCC 23344) TaxID=243160 RepID=A0A0H2WBM6_BURMA|nr:hypothetical protein BMAA0983 [Burkholderia mallei ATCC 23344]
MHPCACARGATRHTFAWRASARRDARGRTRRALEAPRRRNIEALRIRARRRRHRASDSFTVHPRHGLREIVIVRSDRIPLYRRGRRALHHVRVLPPQHGSVQAADRQGLRSRRHARVPAPVAARRRAQARRSRPARHADLRAGQEPPGHPRRAAEKKGRAAGVGRPFPDQAGRPGPDLRDTQFGARVRAVHRYARRTDAQPHRVRVVDVERIRQPVARRRAFHRDAAQGCARAVGALRRTRAGQRLQAEHVHLAAQAMPDQGLGAGQEIDRLSAVGGAVRFRQAGRRMSARASFAA